MTRTQINTDGQWRQKLRVLLCLLTGFQLSACAGELEEDVAGLLASSPLAVNSSPRIPNTPSGGGTITPTTGGMAAVGGMATVGGMAAVAGMAGVGGMGGVAATGGAGDMSNELPLPEGCDPRAIIESPMKCGSAVCHGSPGADPNMQSGLGNMFDSIAERLTDAPGVSEGCADEQIINSADPSQSLLLTKLSMETPQCGTRMPIGFSITDDERECLIVWARNITGAP